MRSGINSVRNPFIFAWLQIKIREKGERQASKGGTFSPQTKVPSNNADFVDRKTTVAFFCKQYEKTKSLHN